MSDSINSANEQPDRRFLPAVLGGDWVVVDRGNRTWVHCEDRGAAVELAASLEALHRIWG